MATGPTIAQQKIAEKLKMMPSRKVLSVVILIRLGTMRICHVMCVSSGKGSAPEVVLKGPCPRWQHVKDDSMD